MAEEGQEKTEAPTGKRLDEAKQKAQDALDIDGIGVAHPAFDAGDIEAARAAMHRRARLGLALGLWFGFVGE